MCVLKEKPGPQAAAFCTYKYISFGKSLGVSDQSLCMTPWEEATPISSEPGRPFFICSSLTWIQVPLAFRARVLEAHFSGGSLKVGVLDVRSKSFTPQGEARCCEFSAFALPGVGFTERVCLDLPTCFNMGVFPHSPNV